MGLSLATNRMALPPPLPSPRSSAGIDMRHAARRSGAATIRRAKVVLTAIAFAAAVVLVTVASWPLKALVVLAFVRGVFASDVAAFRNAPRRHGSTQARPTASSRAPRRRAGAGQGSEPSDLVIAATRGGVDATDDSTDGRGRARSATTRWEQHALTTIPHIS